MRLSVTTPRGALVEADVDEISAPGALGEFGVLPGHVPFLSALNPGVLVYRSKAGGAKVLAVADGVLQVARSGDNDNKILVLVSNAVTAEEVNRESASKDVAAADNELGHWTKEIGGEYRALVTRRAWAQARVDAAARLTAH